MSPDEVRIVSFTTESRGYNRDEVLEHLDIAARALAEANERAEVAENTARAATDDLERALTQLSVVPEGEETTVSVDDSLAEELERSKEIIATLQKDVADLRSENIALKEADGQAGSIPVSEYEETLKRLEVAEKRVLEAESRALEAESRVSEAAESEQLLKRTLVMAQRTADAAVSEARQEAAKLREEANNEATKLRSDATEFSKETRSSAQEYAAKVSKDADEEAARLRDEAAQQAADTVSKANAEAQTIRSDANQDANQMRVVAQQLREEAELQARTVGQMRKVYAAQVRAAIEDHIVAFTQLAELPEIPRQLADLASIEADGARNHQVNKTDSLED